VDIRGGSQDLCKFSLDLMPTPYIAHARISRFFVIKYNCFVYDRYLLIRLPRIVKCVTSGDVASGLAKYDLQSIWNPRQNCGSFLDATLSES